jgi:DNA-binding GntR family transcriptional regulator
MAITTRTDYAYQKLKDLISEGAYPPGNVLTEQTLARELGVSRTPIREAIRRLEADGWVSTIPGRGALVRSLSVQDVEEIFVVREELEALALRLAISNIPSSELEAMEGEMVSMSAELKLDESQAREDLISEVEMFHAVLSRYCGNRLLARQLRSLSELVHRLRVRSLAAPGRPLQSVAEHLEIVRHMRDGDVEAAEESLRRHFRHVKENLTRALQRELMNLPL